MEPLDTLVSKLQKANWAYHNGGDEVMTDDEYDLKLEELKRRCPTHPFLKVIGAPVAKGGVILPVILGSLDKIRYGEGTLEKWMLKQKETQYIVSEKLDGLSALYVCDGKGKRMMYLRGDGVKGVDVSRIFEILSFPPHKCIVRGELVLPLEATKEGSIGRSLVNGWLHRILDKKATVPEELKGVHFVAYQLFEPVGTEEKSFDREEQLKWLKARGFKVPWYVKGSKKDYGEESMKTLLLSRKQESKYPLDGLVVGVNKVPEKVEGGEAKNPEDSIAFKAALDEQREETIVVGIEWNVSRQRYMIPRIQIEPVEIGGAKIQWVSGHNAQMIRDGKIGKGARVMIRRSGDVIPMVESVLEGVEKGDMPEGTDWEWDGVHIRKKEGTKNTEEVAVILNHSLQTLGVEGIGPGLVKKLVEGGYGSLGEIWRAKGGDLGKVIGAGRGPELERKLKEAYGKASQSDLLIASNQLPRGIGEKKLRILYEKEADARKWSERIKDVPAGWSKDTYEEVIEKIPDAFEWIRNTFGEEKKVEVQEVSNPVEVAKNGKIVVFSGVRDKGVEEEFKKKGWEIGDSITKKTSLLVVANDVGEDAQKTGKMKKAADMGIRILRLMDAAAAASATAPA
jgi:NAD-dependent DNA ligase